MWVNNKIKDKFISLLVAVVTAFLSSTYIHACAAHLSNINTCCWFPLLLYFYDRSFSEKSYRYIFPVSIIVCLQIFAGHWQYVYYTAGVSLIYVLTFCRNRYTITVLFSSYLLSLFLAAVQLFSSFDFYLNGSRQLGEEKKGVLYFSKIVYVLTLLFPKYLKYTYDNLWEITAYFGAVNLFIVILALTHAINKNILKTCAIILFLYLLTFKFFADIADKVIPFFSWFRTPPKLLFFTNVLALPIFAQGLKYLFAKRLKINKYFIISCLVISAGIMIFYTNISDFMITAFHYKKMEMADRYMFYNSIIFAGVLIFLFASMTILKRYKIAKIVLILMIVLEPIIMMRTFVHKYEYQSTFNFGFYEREPFNEQTRFFYNINLDLVSGIENCSASYPDALKNYVLFMNRLRQKFNVDNILGLLRCSYIINGVAEHISSIEKTEVKTLKRINLLYDYKYETDKDKIYKIMSDEDFNIFNTVILEKQPQFVPNGKGNGIIKPLYFDETSIVFECAVDSPAIILYTDNFANGWNAYEVDNPSQKYEVICADYIYKAISIDKGYHKIKIEYYPKSFVIGKWVSIISWLVFLLFWHLSRRRR